MLPLQGVQFLSHMPQAGAKKKKKALSQTNLITVSGWGAYVYE